MSAYAASKHGLLGLTRATAVEVSGRGVTCNAVMPGSVRTRTAELRVAEEAAAAGTGVEEAWQRRAERTVAGRLIEPDEVAAAVAFLASDAASGVNGEALGVALQASGLGSRGGPGHARCKSYIVDDRGHEEKPVSGAVPSSFRKRLHDGERCSGRSSTWARR